MVLTGRRVAIAGGTAAPPHRVKIVETWQKEGYIELFSSHLEGLGVQVVRPGRRFAAFDILQLHAPHYLVGPPFWYAALLAHGPRPVVWTAHDVPEAAVDWRFEWTTRLLAKRADAIICHGTPSRRLLVGRYEAEPSRIHVMPHPSFVGLFPRGVTRAEARRRLDLPPDAFVFLHLGNIRRNKGAPRFLQALDRHGDADSLFVVAGSADIDPAEAALLREESARSRRLRLYPGEVPGHRLQLFFAAADVAVFPYNRITTSGAVHLAMSFALPVLGADINCLGADIHPDGGLKYSPFDDDGLDSAIATLRAMPAAERVAMGRRNFERMARWTFADFAAATLRIYDSVTTLRL